MSRSHGPASDSSAADRFASLTLLDASSSSTVIEMAEHATVRFRATRYCLFCGYIRVARQPIRIGMGTATPDSVPPSRLEIMYKAVIFSGEGG